MCSLSERGSMTSKELVKRAIEFKGPERIPVGNVVMDWPAYERQHSKEEVDEARALLSRLPNDIKHLWPNAADDWNPKPIDDRHYEDEWGVVWDREGNKVVGHPLSGGWHLLKELKMPSASAPGRFRGMEEEISKSKDKYLLGWVWFTLFERMWFLRGFENMLIDPYLEYDRFRELQLRILDFNLECIDHWLELGVDGIFMSDDWGSQQSLLINPSDWRKFYKDCYAQMFERIHSGGAHVWMHLCGNITSILDDLIEIGLDVYNPVQPRAVNVAELGRMYRGRLCFNGGSDVQGTLPKGTPDEIEREICFMIENLSDSSGGIILGTSHSILPDTPVANIAAMVDAFEKNLRGKIL